MSMLNKERDVLGAWFKLRREIGLPYNISLGHYRNETGQVTWVDYPHYQFDGVGVLAFHLQQHGYTNIHLPINTHLTPLPLNKKIRLTINPYQNEKPIPAEWRCYDFSKGSNSTDIAWQVLTPQQSDFLEIQAAQHKVSVNSFLFWGLNQICFEYLLNKDSYAPWFYPVNMRSPILKQVSPYANGSCGIYLNLKKEDSTQSLHKKIKQQLKMQSYWGLYYQGRIGMSFGTTVAKKLFAKTMLSARHVGSLSALGTWQAERPSCKPDDEAYLICAPGSPMYPISTGVIKLHSRYTICLRLNHAVVDDSTDEQTLLASWLKQCSL